MNIRMLEFDPNCHLFVVGQSDAKMGLTMVYTFNELGVAFLDFMAIDKGYRNRGVGSNFVQICDYCFKAACDET